MDVVSRGMFLVLQSMQRDDGQEDREGHDEIYDFNQNIRKFDVNQEN